MICIIPAWLYFRTKFLAKIGKKIRTARLSPFYPVLIKKSVYYYWENKDNFEGVGGEVSDLNKYLNEYFLLCLINYS